MEKELRKIKSFVLRKGRMSEAQQKAYNRKDPRFYIPFSQSPGKGKKNGELIVEIGFGMGDATLAIAERFPDKHYLGIEVHKPGVGRVLNEIEKRGLVNLQVIEYDAVEVLEKMIPDRSISGFHLFFPDPWPKKKHHKRRLLNRDFIQLLIRKLSEDGYLFIVTDWLDYSEWILLRLEEEALLSACPDELNTDLCWRPETKFERKGLEKEHGIYQFLYRKGVK